MLQLNMSQMFLWKSVLEPWHGKKNVACNRPGKHRQTKISPHGNKIPNWGRPRSRTTPASLFTAVRKSQQWRCRTDESKACFKNTKSTTTMTGSSAFKCTKILRGQFVWEISCRHRQIYTHTHTHTHTHTESNTWSPVETTELNTSFRCNNVKRNRDWMLHWFAAAQCSKVAKRLRLWVDLCFLESCTLLFKNCRSIS